MTTPSLRATLRLTLGTAAAVCALVLGTNCTQAPVEPDIIYRPPEMDNFPQPQQAETKEVNCLEPKTYRDFANCTNFAESETPSADPLPMMLPDGGLPPVQPRVEHDGVFLDVCLPPSSDADGGSSPGTELERLQAAAAPCFQAGLESVDVEAFVVTGDLRGTGKYAAVSGINSLAGWKRLAGSGMNTLCLVDESTTPAGSVRICAASFADSSSNWSKSSSTGYEGMPRFSAKQYPFGHGGADQNGGSFSLRLCFEDAFECAVNGQPLSGQFLVVESRLKADGVRAAVTLGFEAYIDSSTDRRRIQGCVRAVE